MGLGRINPGCNCCTVCSNTICSPECSEICTDWTFTVSGVTNGTCSSCSAYNGTFTVVFNQATCQADTFDNHGLGGCRIGSTMWNLKFLPGTRDGITNPWLLEASGSSPSCGQANTAALYLIADASFDCKGPNVLSLCSTGANGECSGWPSSITISPA